ncbi:MAG: hypothetical protein K2K16_04975 [Ruminococcus sp.]|nr:hypothetical protein [Ruminococcus sp.]
MNEELDEVQRCAEQYGFLVDEQITYNMEIFSENSKSIDNFEIKFFPSEFMHLTSLGKVKDLWEVNYFKNKNRSSEFLYNEINEKRFNLENISICDYFFDDTAKPDDKTDEEFSAEIQEAKGKHKVLKSELLDRLSALENCELTRKTSKTDKTG